MGGKPPPPSGSAPRPPPAPWLQLVLSLLFMVNMTAGLGGCDTDSCTRAYDVSLNTRGVSRPEKSAAFCGVLYDYGICMYNIRGACRGNINYHTSNSMLVHLRNRFDCARLLKNAPGVPLGVPTRGKPFLPAPPSAPVEAATEPAPTPTPASPECTYRGSRSFKHCGLFGDPHLKTFRATMQTCRVQGAWPLIDNPFLAVQVTNEPVLPGSSATATSKVTVLVKSSSTTCVSQKTYEATAEWPLPETFIDGTNKSGPGDAVVIKHQEAAYGSSVEIFIRYIETTIIVRKVGRYLAFSARMPEELAFWSPKEAAGLQPLCVQGCPMTERMDLATDRGHQLSWAEALARCVAKSPPSQDTNEVAGGLTDQYLDWCVFDLMTTGKDDFVLAARSAHRDTLELDPGALRNRTTAQLVWDVGPGKSFAHSRASNLLGAWRTVIAVLGVLTTISRFAS